MDFQLIGPLGHRVTLARRDTGCVDITDDAVSFDRHPGQLVIPIIALKSGLGIVKFGFSSLGGERVGEVLFLNRATVRDIDNIIGVDRLNATPNSVARLKLS